MLVIDMHKPSHVRTGLDRWIWTKRNTERYRETEGWTEMGRQRLRGAYRD